LAVSLNKAVNEKFQVAAQALGRRPGFHLSRESAICMCSAGAGIGHDHRPP
jgi:hypothetical protein